MRNISLLLVFCIKKGFPSFSILLPLQPGCCSKTGTHFVNTLGKPPFVVMKDCGFPMININMRMVWKRLCDFQRQPFCLLKLPWLDSEWATISLQGGWVPRTHWHCPKALSGDHRLRFRPCSKGNPSKNGTFGMVASQFPVIWVVRWRHTFEKAKGE